MSYTCATMLLFSLHWLGWHVYRDVYHNYTIIDIIYSINIKWLHMLKKVRMRMCLVFTVGVVYWNVMYTNVVWFKTSTGKSNNVHYITLSTRYSHMNRTRKSDHVMEAVIIPACFSFPGPIKYLIQCALTCRLERVSQHIVMYTRSRPGISTDLPCVGVYCQLLATWVGVIYGS